MICYWNFIRKIFKFSSFSINMDIIETLRRNYLLSNTYDINGLYIDLTGKHYENSKDCIDDVFNIIQDNCDVLEQTEKED